jgi:hypothetical protein
VVNRLPVDKNYTGGPLDASTRRKRGDEDQIGGSAPETNALESVIGRIELTPQPQRLAGALGNVAVGVARLGGRASLRRFQPAMESA